MDTTLIKAAGIRALRTFLQGVVSGGVITAAVAIANDGADVKVLVTALVLTVGTAVTSFIQGILAGLPEALPEFSSATVTYEPEPESDFVDYADAEAGE